MTRNPAPRISKKPERSAGLTLGTLLTESRVETMPAARLVRPLRADEDPFAAGDQTLRVVRRRAADHANRERLRDVFRDGEQLRHWLERLAEIVLIEARDDHALALIRQSRADSRQLGIEELSLVDAHHFSVRGDAIEQLARRGDALGLNLHRAMRDDVVPAVAVV